MMESVHPEVVARWLDELQDANTANAGSLMKDAEAQTEWTLCRNGRLDRRFTIPIHPKRFFRCGKVFRMIWAEPAGGTASSKVDSIFPGKYDQGTYSSTKNFVVIAERHNYCLALRINSHHGHGAEAKGVNPAENAQVYTVVRSSSSRPNQAPKPGHPKLLKGSICVVPDQREQDFRLDFTSLINFGKVYTIEHNFKVHGRGRVHSDSMGLLKHLYDGVQKAQSDAVQNPSVQLQRPSPMALQPPMPSIPAFMLPQQFLPVSRRLSVPIYRVLSGITTFNEPYDNDFYERQSSFFTRGKVFRIKSWEERLTAGSPDIEEESTSSQITEQVIGCSRDGPVQVERCYWFVVIKECQRSSLCLRILSYDHYGVTEGHLKADHSMVFCGKNPPDPTYSEATDSDDPTFLRPSVRIRRTDYGSDLHPTHRLRYNTVYRVLHNVKACEFGEVHPNYRWIPEHQFREHLRRRQAEETYLPTSHVDPLTAHLCRSVLLAVDNSESSEDEQETRGRTAFGT